MQHACDVEAYINKEVAERAPLGSFKHPPFHPWCQVNALLTRPKKDSAELFILMELSWPHPPLHSMNAGTQIDKYLGQPPNQLSPQHKTSVSSSVNLSQAHSCSQQICASAYCQLLLHLGDWCLRNSGPSFWPQVVCSLLQFAVK